MSKYHPGRRGHGVVRDTIHTTEESIDGALFALSTSSRLIWRWRVRRTGLDLELQELVAAGLSGFEPPWLWSQRSVKVETVVVLIASLLNVVAGMPIWAYVVPIVVIIMFLSVEADNTAQEWLIDTLQIKLLQPGKEDIFVRLIKHTASGPVFRINSAGGLAWVTLIIWHLQR